MSASLTPYLNFAGNAREAVDFYASVFGGTPDVMTYAAFSPPDDPNADKIMHSYLRGDSGVEVMCADLPPDQELAPGGQITCAISGDDEALLTGYWNQLSDGGMVTVALEKQMWGDTFGMCIDRFGIPWMVNITGTPADN